MEIREVNTIEEARECDKLLTELIRDEITYNKNIDPTFVVKNYFENLYMKDNNLLLIAVENNNISGYIFVREIKEEGFKNVMLIDGLYVNEEYRNQGIASKLIEESLKWIKEQGSEAVKIKVMSDNIKAVNLYQKFGFTELSKELINYL